MISRPSSGSGLPPSRLSSISRTTSKPALNTSSATSAPMMPSMGKSQIIATTVEIATAVVASMSDRESFAAAIREEKSISRPTPL